MISLKLDESGDISFDSLGKLEVISDEDALRQSFFLRLQTLKGELFYNDEYGHPKLKGKQNESSISDYLKDALLDDERISDVVIISFVITSFGKYKVDAEIYLNNGEFIDFDFLV